MEHQLYFLNAQEAFEYFFDKINSKGINTNIGTRALYNVNICILRPKDRLIKTEWRKWRRSMQSVSGSGIYLKPLS